MCGIAGIVGRNFEETAHPIHEMTSRLAHRGPDASGHFIDEHIALGHRRLSIIDLSEASNQPFTDITGRYIIIFNGEIYNYNALKSELDYPFRTKSDTEVVLAAYIKWNRSCLDRFNGMFTFAIWDKETQELFMARDRLGIKPLYLATIEGTLLFSSEMRSLLATGLIPKLVDPIAVTEFLTWQSVKAPRTIISGVCQLLPGHYATFRNGELLSSSYWNPGRGENVEVRSVGDAKKEIKKRVYESVERRMISDVPLGAFLSGGIDSSAIVGVMSDISKDAVNTFSVVFDDPQFDESKYSSLVAKRFNTNHQKVLLRPEDLLQDLPDALTAMDTPTADGINSYVVSKATRSSGLKVALSGLGGDELFGGYPVFTQYPKILSSFIWNIPRPLRKAFMPLLLKAISPSKRNRFEEILLLENPEFAELYPIFRKLNNSKEVRGLYANDINKKDLNKANPIVDHLDVFTQISLAEISNYTQPILLNDADQMSMAHALEVRVPFFDHELVDFVIGLSGKIKDTGYPKGLLVDSLEGLLPHEIVQREKKGFALPWTNWMKNDLNNFCAQNLERLEEFNGFNMSEIQTQWSKFNQGSPHTHWNKIWLLVVLSHWLNKHLK